MYDLEIIEEEAFFKWKDEINENYPSKGQALFYVNTFKLYWPFLNKL
jgi:translation initiation factor 4G